MALLRESKENASLPLLGLLAPILRETLRKTGIRAVPRWEQLRYFGLLGLLACILRETLRKTGLRTVPPMGTAWVLCIYGAVL